MVYQWNPNVSMRHWKCSIIQWSALVLTFLLCLVEGWSGPLKMKMAVIGMEMRWQRPKKRMQIARFVPACMLGPHCCPVHRCSRYMVLYPSFTLSIFHYLAFVSHDSFLYLSEVVKCDNSSSIFQTTTTYICVRNSIIPHSPWKAGFSCLHVVPVPTIPSSMTGFYAFKAAGFLPLAKLVCSTYHVKALFASWVFMVFYCQYLSWDQSHFGLFSFRLLWLEQSLVILMKYNWGNSYQGRHSTTPQSTIHY